jgi:thiosulfate reductase cytochrome b subunit
MGDTVSPSSTDRGPRHSLATRLWHWTNVVALAVLFPSGLNISNAHPWLYWGEAGSTPSEAWLALPRFPHWATIPGYYSLADARLWHFLAAWPFAIAFALFLVALVLSRHRRDFALSRRDLTWTALRADIAHHLRLEFAPSAGAAFNLLQKHLYIAVLFVLLPLMIFTGLALSPQMGAAAPWLVEGLGGRQSARSLHFLAAWALFGFAVLHVLAVLLSGPARQLRDMITGGGTPAEGAA